jgi:alanine dehydrogenase
VTHLTALLLSESQVKDLASVREAVECIENCFQNIGDQGSENYTRTRTKTRTSTLNVMHGSLSYLGRAGTKIYYNGRFVFVLFDSKTQELLAVMGAKEFGKLRTGAASAVATKYLATLKSFIFGLAGTGKQALFQVTALEEIANIEKIYVWSPTSAHRSDFAKELERRSGIDAIPRDSVLDAFKSVDVATTITTAREPFVSKEAASGPIHINSCGSNHPDRSELTVESLTLYPKIYVDDLRQAQVEAGDLIRASSVGVFNWSNAIELKDIVQRKEKRIEGVRTLFRSLGIALEDIAIASLIYDKALKEGDKFQRFEFQ